MTLAQELVEIPLSKLDPSPWNPRRIRDNDPAITSLSESILAVGLKQPILVRKMPRKRYQIVAGHRRAKACELAKLKTIPSLLEDLDDDAAREITVLENLQREDLHPMEEAMGIAALLQNPLATLETVADRLGKSVDWVARRRRLCQLTTMWRKLSDDPESPVHLWPASWLEEIAVLAPESQDYLLEENRYDLAGFVSRKELRAIVGDYLHLLKTAPWPLDDATLYKDVGACEGCPERTSSQQHLFPLDGSEDDNDRCLDPVCWERKKQLFVAKRRAEMQKQHGNVVEVARYGKTKEFPAAVPEYSMKVTKRPTKGSKPAIFVEGPRAGETVYVKPNASTSSSGATEKGTKRTLKEKRELLRKRRLRSAIDKIVESSAEAVHPRHDELCRLILAFGLQLPYRAEPWETFAEDRVNLDLDLWDHVRPKILDWLRDQYRPIDDTWDGACTFARLCCLNPVRMHEEAIEEIPEPNAWVKESKL